MHFASRFISPRCNIRCGAVLFEVMLSIALFTGAAAFTLAAVRSVYITLDRTSRQHEAIDLARSKMAQLEAGLITLADLRSGADDASEGNDSQSKPRWVYELRTQRTEYTGLTLVELTVHEQQASKAAADNAMSYTLRQLMNLRTGSASESAALGDEEFDQ
jgi:hypothetical protein